MKFEIDREIFSRALGTVRGVVDKKSALPILSNVLLRASEDGQRIRVMATDLEISIETSMKAHIEESGPITLPSKRVLDILRNSSQERIEIESSGAQLVIRAGKSRFELPTLSAENFPLIPSIEGIKFFPCDKPALHRALSKIFYVVPLDGDAFSAPGAWLHRVEPDKYRLVSTDGHRVVFSELREEALNGAFGEMALEGGILIPRKGANEMIRFLEEEGEVFLAAQENRIFLKMPEVLLVIQLLEGDFPDYECIIPPELPHSLTLDTEEFKGCLKRMGTLASEKFHAINLNIGGGELEFKIRSVDLASAEDRLEIEYEGEPISLFYNLKYLMEMTQNIWGERFVFKWLDNAHAALFMENVSRETTHLIMPMVV